MSSSPETKILPPLEVQKPSSPEAPEDSFSVEIYNPDTLYLLAVKQAYEGNPQVMISNTALQDELFSSETTRLGFEQDTQRLENPDTFNLISKIFLSDQRKMRADHGYFSKDRISRVQKNLEDRGIKSTACSNWPDASNKSFTRNLLYVGNDEHALRIDFGFASEKIEKDFIVWKAKQEQGKGVDGPYRKQLKNISEGLLNNAVTVSLAMNNVAESFQFEYVTLEGAQDFRQKLQDYASVYENIIRALYATQKVSLPDKHVVFNEAANTENALSSEWLVDEGTKNKFPSFTEVGGQKECVALLEELVHMINNPEVFSRRGVSKDKGVLLCGEPGNGKSLLLQAVAREANAAVLLVSSADINNMWYGESGRKVKKIFEDADKIAQQGTEVIIGFEEMDAVVPQRHNAHEETKKVVATFLEYLDGPRANPHITFIGTTNRPEDIDPAIRRPGRIDAEIEVKKPDLEGRMAILEIHMNKARSLTDRPDELFQQGLDIAQVAKITEGMSGAQLASLVASTLRGKAVAEVKGEEWSPVSEEDLVSAMKRQERKSRGGSIGFTVTKEPQTLYNRA